MFKKTSPQSSLFDPNMIVPGILPADDWSYIYREKIYPLIDEDKFRHLYEEIKDELSQNYLEKDFDLTEKDKDKAHRRISEMAKDLYRIADALPVHSKRKRTSVKK